AEGEEVLDRRIGGYGRVQLGGSLEQRQPGADAGVGRVRRAGDEVLQGIQSQRHITVGERYFGEQEERVKVVRVGGARQRQPLLRLWNVPSVRGQRRRLVGRCRYRFALGDDTLIGSFGVGERLKVQVHVTERHEVLGGGLVLGGPLQVT